MAERAVRIFKELAKCTEGSTLRSNYPAAKLSNGPSLPMLNQLRASLVYSSDNEHSKIPREADKTDSHIREVGDVIAPDIL